MTNELRRALIALSLELPAEVARDISALVHGEVAKLEKERDDAKAEATQWHNKFFELMHREGIG